jgi:hypothetical protein
VFTGLNEAEVRELMKNSIKKELAHYNGPFDLKSLPKSLTDFFLSTYYPSNWAGNLIKFFGKHFRIFLGLISEMLLDELPAFNLHDRTSGNLQKFVIEQNYPELGEMPYCHDRFNNRKTIRMAIRKFIYNVKFLTNRITHRFFNFNFFKYFPDLPHYYWVWLPKHHKKFILDTLNYDTMITKDLFKKEELEKIVKLFLKSDYSVKGFTMSLISLEIYLKSINKNNKIVIGDGK